MKKHFYTFAALAVSLCTSLAQGQTTIPKSTTHKSTSKSLGHKGYKSSKLYDNSKMSKSDMTKVGDRAQDRINYANDRTFNLEKNGGTLDRRSEVKFATSASPLPSAITGVGAKRINQWENRGPYNVGGRTRALAIDRRYENVLFAGGISGGLWRSRDSGENWRKVTRFYQAPGISCIVQDPRPGRGYIWYYGTGESRGNSASGGGAYYAGTGVYKSQDSGLTWELLSATEDNDLTRISPFELIHSIKVDPTNGYLFVATLNGIHRSKDGGQTFDEVLVGEFGNWTEIEMTPNGTLFASIEAGEDTDAPDTGIFVSKDLGDTWSNITPTDYPEFFGRTVFGVNPKDENEVYVFSASVNNENVAYLWRYNANSEQQWTDLSANLPLLGGPVGNLNTQGGYDMFVRVHPENTDLVFLGGTNIYRSFDGFQSPVGEGSWIAGYSPINNVSTYPDQHPDQHEFLFFPSNPNKVLSANDGGVFVTEDITATLSNEEPVDWTSLNNGYVTTQPYSVSYDPAGNSDDVLAGFQDNGTWYSNNVSIKAPWIEDFGGDGSFNAIADGGLSRYVSSQNGRLYRLNFDTEGEFETFARVQPAGPSDFGFINPFILDPNNDNIMYMPIGRTIWRNNDLDAIPLGSNAPTTVNWVEVKESTVPSIVERARERNTITALDVSKYPEANKLYFGTGRGHLYRIDNANVDKQDLVDIWTGKGLPENGYVSSVAVDPSNSDRVMIAFSNYGVQSVFITKNAGDTWTNISGNLEENEDGSGNGSSVRSVAFLGNNDGYFAATSTGLYFTNRLEGNYTVWRRDSWKIGNAVAEVVKSRKDGFTIVGTHGNGIFNKDIRVSPRPKSTLSVAYLLNDVRIPVESPDLSVEIKDLFIESTGAPITVKLTNSNPEFAEVRQEGTTLLVSFQGTTEGSTTIELVATANGQQVAEGLTISTFVPPIYEQADLANGVTPSQNFIDFNAIAQVADDFEVPEDKQWIIERITASGAQNGAPVYDNVQVVVYADNAGVPGIEVYNSQAFKPVSEDNSANLDLQLPEAISLESGKYWITIIVEQAYSPGANQWFWSTQLLSKGEETRFRDEQDLFGTGATDWTPTSTIFAKEPTDQVFKIYGAVQDSFSSATENGANDRAEDLVATLDAGSSLVVYPNPSSNVFTFKFGASEGTASLKIFNITGQLVLEKEGINLSSDFIWDGSTVAAGYYTAILSTPKTTYKTALLKL